MKAIAVGPGAMNIALVERPEPQIGAADEVKVHMLRVGICGTDREELKGWVQPPTGQTDMIIGHENFGQVVEVGAAVTRFKPGDFCVFTVRRPCGQCLPCATGRTDMCSTGMYTERGIHRQDGYQAEFVIDKEQYAVLVPAELETIGVLAEPISVVEKAIDSALRVQFARLPDALAAPNWLAGRRCLVTGLGPIGLLAAMVLRLRGAEVYGADIVDESSPRPQWLVHIGGRYIDSRTTPPTKIAAEHGGMDLLIEASGGSGVAFAAPSALARNGIMVIVGVPHDDRGPAVGGAELLRLMVLGNLALVGTVNAGRGHIEMGIADLAAAQCLWGDHVAQLITERVPYPEFASALMEHRAGEIKCVIEWAKP